MKRARLLILPLIAITALALAGCGATVAAGPPTVETAQVARGHLASNAQVSGKLAAAQSADLFTMAAGRVAAVNVDVGSHVTKGQVLLTLDSSAEAAALATAEAGAGQARAAVNTAEAQENLYLVNYQTAESNYLRGKKLLAQGAIPEGGQYGFDTAYKLPYQQADIAAHKTGPAAVAQARAAIVTAEAQVQSARVALDNTILKAPFTGIITSRNVNPGAMSAGPPAIPGQVPPLLVEVKLDPIYAEFNVSGDEVNGLAQGQKVPVTVTGASDRSLTGTISHVAPAANPNTKTYLVQVTLSNPDGTLKPGMFSSVSFNENTTGFLLVPNEAVVQQGSTSIVWVVVNGTAQSRTVELGATDGQNTVVDSGLAAGDTVIISGQQGLTQGEKVAVQKS